MADTDRLKILDGPDVDQEHLYLIQVSRRRVKIYLLHKKVLLRERKRHTARRVESTPSVVLTGYPPVLTWLGGTLPWYPPPAGYPPGRVHPPEQDTPQQGTPPGWTWQGTPPSWTWQGNPPPVCPMAFWEMLQSIMGYGYPPPPVWTDKQSETITFPSYYVRGR